MDLGIVYVARSVSLVLLGDVMKHRYRGIGGIDSFEGATYWMRATCADELLRRSEIDRDRPGLFGDGIVAHC